MTEGLGDSDAAVGRLRPMTAAKRPGRLKVFFGAAPGVGKTYAMLEAARRARDSGTDVAIACADTHGRAETAALLEGLEQIPRRAVEYRGLRIEELDLDAVLVRRPLLVLVDELAHTNAPGSRHKRRWQDVKELLAAGLDVWTTLNVQHVESLNDVVAQITGIHVRETVPDSMLEQAEQIELVDLPPEALLQRLAEGKVYLPEQAQRAAGRFFRRGNLLALRELALRRTAERVDADVRAYRRQHGIEATWPAAERILVCVGPGPHAARLVRAARRMAAGLRADWTAVYVEVPAHARLPQEDRDWVAQHLRLAESLGGRAAQLSGESVSTELLAYAREHNATKILVGKPTHSPWRDLWHGSLLDQIIRGSGDIEVYVSSGDPTEALTRRPPPLIETHSPIASYLTSLAVVALATSVAFLMYERFQTTDLVMVYLLATTYVGVRLGRGPALMAATLGVAAFDFCFVPPRYTFAVHDVIYLPTFGAMLVVGLIVSTLAAQARERAEAARAHAQWSATLHAFARELAQARDAQAIATASVRQIETALGGHAGISVLAEDGDLIAAASADGPVPGASERAVERWVQEHGQPAGRGTETLPDSAALYVPLSSGSRTVGVLRYHAAAEAALSDGRQRQMLEALAQQAAGAIERALLAEEAQQVELRARAEELRNSLLSSVSHDLRTPLAAIVGSATTLLGEAGEVRPDQSADLVRNIYEEAQRLTRLVTNLLAMTRLESASISPKKEWVPLEEIVGSALARLADRATDRTIALHIPPDLPLVSVDPVLIEQVLVNLLENALQHTPTGTPVEVLARAENGAVEIDVQDRGPGLPPEAGARLFTKFYRGPGAPRGGSGLGLAICRGMVAVHGGTMEAFDRPGGGAIFRIRLPVEGQAPAVPAEPVSDSDVEH